MSRRAADELLNLARLIVAGSPVSLLFSAMSVLTLTTDFGTNDWFVGVMKGVVLSIAPDATIVDISHDIPAGDVGAAAFVLAAACRYFPRGTVHVAVVDPGVGSQRSAIAVQTDIYLFVGPDNGVLSLALAGQKVKAIHRIENETLFRKPVSASFHGRDVFAPVAAHLSLGAGSHKVGPGTRHYSKLELPIPHAAEGVISGEVIHIDRFGNAITNIGSRLLSGAVKANCHVVVRGRRLCALSSHYAAVAEGKPLALVNSCDLLEIAVNGGSAADCFRLKKGLAVSVRTVAADVRRRNASKTQSATRPVPSR